MYKLLQIVKTVIVCGIVYKVDVKEILCFDKELLSRHDIDSVFHCWLSSHNYPTDDYLICEYDKYGNYVKATNVVSFTKSGLVDTFVDGAEWDYRVLAYIAHNPPKDSLYKKAIINAIEEYDLWDDVCDLINKEFYARDL